MKRVGRDDGTDVIGCGGMSLRKSKRHESAKLRKSAKGQECQVRIPGICNGNNETTVLAHLNGGGMGTKKSDLMAAFACSSCHDALDGRVRTQYFSNELDRMHREGVERTQQIWLDSGLVVLA